MQVEEDEIDSQWQRSTFTYQKGIEMPYTPHTNATTQSRQAYLAVKITVARGNFTTDGAEQLLLRLPIHCEKQKDALGVISSSGLLTSDYLQCLAWNHSDI